MLLPNFVVVLEGCPSAVAFKIVLILQNKIHILRVVVVHVGNATSLLLILILELFDFLGLTHDDSVEELVLIVGFVELVILSHLGDELLELLDLLPIFQGLVGDHPHLSGQVGLLELLVGHGDALLVELKESFHELKEEKVVVVDE